MEKRSPIKPLAQPKILPAQPREQRERYLKAGIIVPHPDPERPAFFAPAGWALRPHMHIEAVKRTRAHHIKTGTIVPKQKKLK